MYTSQSVSLRQSIWTLMHQSFEIPAPSHSGLSQAFTFYATESEWRPRFPGTKVSGAFPPPLLFNTWHSLCKTTVGSHEINRLIFKRPANNVVGDAKTDFKPIPRLPGDQNEVYMRWKSLQSPTKARMGVAGVSNDWLPNKWLVTKQLF